MIASLKSVVYKIRHWLDPNSIDSHSWGKVGGWAVFSLIVAIIGARLLGDQLGIPLWLEILAGLIFLLLVFVATTLFIWETDDYQNRIKTM